MKRPFSILTLLALVALAAVPGGVALAAAEPEPDPGYEEIMAFGVPVPEPEWRQLSRGNTVWYYADQELWGREYYDMRRDRVMFQFYNGECQPGDWSFAEGIYCFDFHSGPPHCFRHLRYEGRLWVLALNRPMVQEVRRVDPGGFSCEPSPMS